MAMRNDTVFVPLTADARVIYLDAVLNAQDDEEAQLYKIREWHEGRQLEDLGDIEQYLSATFAAMFADYPVTNIIAQSVNIVRERLKIKEFTGSGLSTRADAWWQQNDMDSWQKDLYEYVLRDRAAVVIVGWDGVKNRPVFNLNELYDGTGGYCRLHFDSNDALAYVSRRWNEHDPNDIATGRVRLTIYFADRIERWVTDQGQARPRLMTLSELAADKIEVVGNPEPWLMPDGTPMGIAAVPFYNSPYISEPKAVMTVQSSINDAIMSWHAATRYGGFRVLVTENVETRKDVNGNEVPLKWGPGVRINLKAVGATAPPKVYFLPAEDLKNIFEGGVIPNLRLAAHAKRWPLHLFDVQSMPQSGEVITQLEAPFVAQVDDKKPVLADSFRRMFDMAQKVAHVYGNEPLSTEDLTDMEVAWEPSRTPTPTFDLQQAGVKINQLQMPAEFVWGEMGYSVEQIAEMKKIKSDNAAEFAQNTARASLLASSNPDGQPTPAATTGP